MTGMIRTVCPDCVLTVAQSKELKLAFLKRMQDLKTLQSNVRNVVLSYW